VFLLYNFRIVLKSLAILAVLLAVAQAPVPTTGKASNDGTNNSDHASQSGKSSKNPAEPASLIPAQNHGSDSLKPEGAKGSGANQQGTINITNATSVPVSWSLPKWAAWFAWIANLVLTGFLVWGVIVAKVTLGAIKRQADHMENTNRNAVNAQRARLAVDIPPDRVSIRAILWAVHFRVDNLGRSQAYNLDIFSHFELTNSFVPPEINSFDLAGSAPILAENRWMNFMSGQESLTGGFSIWTESDLNAVAAGTRFLHVAGVVNYEDVFGEHRTAPFRFMWTAGDRRTGEEPDSRWMPAFHASDPKAT
jgi:hypothetical protein